MAMPYDKYEVVIGLEIHAQLLTSSKAFSPDPAYYGARYLQAQPSHHLLRSHRLRIGV